MSSHNLESLISLAETLRVQTDFGETLRLVSNHAESLLGADYAAILMINPKTRETIRTIHKPKSLGEKSLNYIAGWMIHHRQAILANAIHKDQRFCNVDFKGRELSVVGALLEIEDMLLGSLIVVRDAADDNFTEADLDYLRKLTTIAVPYLRHMQKIAEFFQTPVPEQTILSRYAAIGLIGKCKPFMELLKAVDAAARSDIRILLEGESGSGKELVARAIHTFGERQDGPFVAVDCGAIPENLMESEFFGHVRGAFTGAVGTRKGLFEAAHGGTLFLDEITNLSLPIQVKLMRVLQEGEVRALGSNEVRQVDVRVISASSSSLPAIVKAGQFREDLYYRLHIYPIHIPSLNDRRKDIGLLINHFIEKNAGLKLRFDPKVIDFLKQRDWPGNIRELQNLVERVLAVTPPEMHTIKPGIMPTDLREEFESWRKNSLMVPRLPSFSEQMLELERKVIIEALESCDWNQSQAARLLRMSERNIRHKMQKLSITRPQ